MNPFIEIKAEQLKGNPFEMIGKDWMLITAKKEDQVNTMTASWGGFGVMWNKKVAYIVIRPQRYTKEFVDFSDKFSLSFFDQSYKKDLSYLGKVSGREEDKIKQRNLTVIYDEEVPYFKEASTVLICKKLLNMPYKEEYFIDSSIIEKNYPGKDYHTLYIGEIEKVFIKE